MILICLIKVIFSFDEEYIAACNTDSDKCERHNFYNNFTLPLGYNRNHAPSVIIDIEMGMYWNQLLYLDTATESFGLNYQLHLRWDTGFLNITYFFVKYK